MKRAYWTILLVFVVTAHAHGAALDDFNQGVTANIHGESDVAIAALTRALSASDLLPDLRPAALIARGKAYLKIKAYDKAIADFDNTIKLQPAKFEAYRWRAGAYRASGQDSSAASDCDTIIKLPLVPAPVLGWCGELRFEMGDFAQSYAMLKSAVELDSSNPYTLMWFELARRRSSSTDEDDFGFYVRSLTNQSWPMPIIDLYLGRESLNLVTFEAESRDSETDRERKCEVGFYGGEWQVLHGDVSDARVLLQQAVNLCPDDYDELLPAKTELARLGGSTGK